MTVMLIAVNITVPSFHVLVIFTAMLLTSDVAAFSKQECAHQTCLAGLMIPMLASAVTAILPTFNSQIICITGNSHLLGLCSLCQQKCDDCSTDHNKITKPGLCGCTVPNTNVDVDRTTKCKDCCLHDASKTSLSACGGVIPNTYMDGNGTYDCKDNCLHDACPMSSGACACGIPDNNVVEDGTP